MNGDTNLNDANPNPATEPATGAEESGAETRPIGFCRECGRALRAANAHEVGGTLYCAEHAPAPPPPSNSEWAAPPPPATAGSPGLAFVLGLIPGVGAIYNAQYAKGLVHVVVFGLFVSLIGSGAGALEPLLAMMLTAWIFYMAFEAYHTAKKRQLGLPVDEFSSLAPMRAGSAAGPIVLIVGGVFFLLINLDLIEFYKIARFWPVLLIALGAWMLYSRRSGSVGREE